MILSMTGYGKAVATFGSKKIYAEIVKSFAAIPMTKTEWTVIGIGLNVNQTSFPEDLPNPTSMARLNAGGDLNDILREFMDIFTRLSLLQ